MPYNPITGVFTRPSNSFSQPISGTIIDPVDADALFDAYDAALTTSYQRSRNLLAADTTFYIRSDGNDSNTGLTDDAAGAFLTWNALFAHVAAAYDFNGHIVTLQSGTTNTYAGGLTFAVAWVGGGSLVVDLNGASIAETTTKGIINNIVQPGTINIKNSKGLGVGGSVSSLNFAGVQNSAASQIAIGIGITTGTCLDAAYEATQGSLISLTAPINVAGTGGHTLVLTSLGGSFAFNSQTVNFTSNKTYTVATVSAQFNSTILANGTTFNLNPGGGPFTVSGPRYNADNGGKIYTAGAGATFIPGTTAGTLASGGGYDGNLGTAVVIGGSATNSFLTLQSTSNAAPLNDGVNISGSNTSISAPLGTTNVFLGNPGATSPIVNFAGSSTGSTNLKAAAAASGTLTLPAATDTLAGKATTDTFTNKTISATANTLQIPYFAAELSANQGTTTTTINKVLNNTEIGDPNGWYDNATNYRWTPQLAGKYQITAAVGVSGTTVTEVDLYIKKNGTTNVGQSFIIGLATATAQSATITKTVSFNGTTDYVEMYAAAFGAGTLNFLAAPSTWFEAKYLGA